jgi:Tol biopolymer transport system component
VHTRLHGDQESERQKVQQHCVETGGLSMLIKSMTKGFMGLICLTVGLGLEANGMKHDSGDELIGKVRDIYPSWSPDGLKLAFHSTRMGPVAQIFTLELATGNVTQLTTGPGEKRLARWSPDGKRLTFHREPDDQLTGDIFVINADGTGLKNVTDDQAVDYHANWVSNDQLIFDSDRDHDGESRITNRELYLLTLSTGEVSRLTRYDDWDTYGSLSPDGKRITWRRIVKNGDGSRNAEVFVMNADGSNKINLSPHTAFDAYPTWSPDGQRILFASNRNEENYEDFNLYLVNPDGTELAKLTETRAHVEQIRPMYSPDGRAIVYNQQYLDGRIEIHILRLLDKKSKQNSTE